MRAKKLQSSMEYLMTYGWAVLVAAFIIGAFFQLGLFSPNLSPKGPTGSCSVFRPNGPGSNSNIALLGICHGELPNFVASSNRGAQITAPGAPSSWVNGYTISAWVRINQYPGTNFLEFAGAYSSPGESVPYLDLNLNNGNLVPFIEFCTAPGNCAQGYASAPLSIGTWYNLIGTWSASNNQFMLYVNGVANAGATYSITTLNSPSFYFAQGFNGLISNIQIYNTSLSQSEAQGLYHEGIGGAPLKLSNIVAWWPLNGNSNDYSGNGYQGSPSGVSFTAQWQTGYTPP